jgi:hypothetical protein
MYFAEFLICAHRLASETESNTKLIYILSSTRVAAKLWVYRSPSISTLRLLLSPRPLKGVDKSCHLNLSILGDSNATSVTALAINNFEAPDLGKVSI